jgi:hypothetical protein
VNGWRSIATGSLSLVALQVFTTSSGPERGGALLTYASTLLDKAISPKVAAIPTSGKGKAAAPAPAPKSTTGTTPAATGPIGLPTNPVLQT